MNGFLHVYIRTKTPGTFINKNEWERMDHENREGHVHRDLCQEGGGVEDVTPPSDVCPYWEIRLKDGTIHQTTLPVHVVKKEVRP